MSVIRGIEVPKFDEMEPGHVKIHVPVFQEAIQIHTGKLGQREYLRVAAVGNERVISRVDGDFNVAIRPFIKGMRGLFHQRPPAYNILDEAAAGIVIIGSGNGLYDLDDERVKVGEHNADAFSSFLRKVAWQAVDRQNNPKRGSTDRLR